MRPSELDDSVLNAILVGVATSVEEETDDGNIGTDVNGWSGDCGGAEVRGDGDPGIVLIRSSDDGDPLGRKKEVSNDTSTSCSATDWTEGEGWRTEDSYEKFDTDAHGRGPRGRTDDEVCVNDDRLLDDETVDIDSGSDNTGLGEITNVKGGKLDAVETDEKASEDGVITEVEPRVESGEVGSKLRLTVSSSEESSLSSGEDNEVIGIWKELGVLASETSTELSNGVGVGDNTNDADGVDKGRGGNEGEGEGGGGWTTDSEEREEIEGIEAEGCAGIEGGEGIKGAVAGEGEGDSDSGRDIERGTEGTETEGVAGRWGKRSSRNSSRRTPSTSRGIASTAWCITALAGV